MNSVLAVTIFHNRKALAARSLQSLEDQDYQNLQVIAVDDGSVDGTAEVLMNSSSARCKIITSNNFGFTNQLVNAIESSNSEYIAIHGSGDISYPSRISKQVQFLEDNASVGVVGCRTFDHRSNSTNINSSSQIPINPERQIISRNFFHHGEVLFRRSIYEMAGGYRRFFIYAQDRDLWCRMSRHASFGICSEVLYERGSKSKRFANFEIAISSNGLF